MGMRIHRLRLRRIRHRATSPIKPDRPDAPAGQDIDGAQAILLNARGYATSCRTTAGKPARRLGPGLLSSSRRFPVKPDRHAARPLPARHTAECRRPAPAGRLPGRGRRHHRALRLPAQRPPPEAAPAWITSPPPNLVRHPSWEQLPRRPPRPAGPAHHPGAAGLSSFRVPRRTTRCCSAAKAPGSPREVHGAAGARLRIPLEAGQRSLNVARGRRHGAGRGAAPDWAVSRGAAMSEALKERAARWFDGAPRPHLRRLRGAGGRHARERRAERRGRAVRAHAPGSARAAAAASCR